MKTLSIDIETYSPEPLAKCGVYRYCQAPEFEVLLFGYSVDGGPVQVVDLAAGECIPTDVLAALTDPFPSGPSTPSSSGCVFPGTWGTRSDDI